MTSDGWNACMVVGFDATAPIGNGPSILDRFVAGDLPGSRKVARKDRDGFAEWVAGIPPQAPETMNRMRSVVARTPGRERDPQTIQVVVGEPLANVHITGGEIASHAPLAIVKEAEARAKALLASWDVSAPVGAFAIFSPDGRAWIDPLQAIHEKRDSFLSRLFKR